jgi:4-aminobutyrate aminotransferase-like enzyme
VFDLIVVSRRTKKILQTLRDYESPNILFCEPDGSWPIVWERARDCSVWDAEGKKYLDLTAAFGVAAAGHSNPRVVAAARKQMSVLLHAMGDVHPHPRKAELARALSKLTFERWTAGSASPQTGKTIFTNSGFEAVEAALKTALLSTKKSKVLAFAGAYHGLGYGALNATHRLHFRAPFRPQLREFSAFAPFPKSADELPNLEKRLRRLLESTRFGAVIVEPIQVRGGINIPPTGFLSLLRKLCDEFRALLILDEIYTGFGRTGQWFACEHSGVVPDLICLGKAMSGGFPISACVGRAALVDAAWPRSTGEAIHTSTFLGHPVGCAMALAQIAEIESRNLTAQSKLLGAALLEMLASELRSDHLQIEVRGSGLLAGVEIRDHDGSPATQIVWRSIKEMLRRGFILLPEGEHGNIISFSPPLTIKRRQLSAFVAAMKETLALARLAVT